MRIMNVENFQAHVMELSQAFDIGVLFDRELTRSTARALRLSGINELDRWMGMKEKMIHTHPIDDETSYAVVMHEMGHHLAPNGFCSLSKPKPGCHPRDVFAWAAAKLIAEEAAWEWAQYYVEQVFIWTVGMEQAKQYAFNTYLKFRRTGQ